MLKLKINSENAAFDQEGQGKSQGAVISSPYATWRQDRVDAVEGALGDYPEDCGW